MCNLYHMAPRDHIEVFFRATVPQYSAAAPQACAEGQTSGCVGGKAEVIVLPASAARVK